VSVTVWCESEDCKWNKNGECDRGVISLDCDNECCDFESYLDEAEWKKPFWKRIQDSKTKQIFRVLYYGKEIDVNGRKFFVESKSDYAYATDAITGCRAGRQAELKNRIEAIMKAASKLDFPLLESLPIGVYDEKTRRVLPKEGEQK
jgi:hypothetical protein